MRNTLLQIVFTISTLVLVSCSSFTLTRSTTSPMRTETPPNTSTSSPTATTTPNFTATQQAVELQETKIAQETQAEIFAQETQIAHKATATAQEVSVQATAQANATKQAQEAVENQKVNAFLNQVESEFFTDENLTISTTAGELHFADKLIENKNLDNWRLTKGEAQYFLEHFYGLLVTNLTESDDNSRIRLFRHLDRTRDDLANSDYFVNIARSVKSGGILNGQFCNSGQCIEGEFEEINIWFGRYKQVDEFRQLALDNNISIVDGLNLKDISKSFSDTNSFMVIGNQQVYIFAGSLPAPFFRSQSYQSCWEFERVNWEATKQDMRASFSLLMSEIISSIGYTAYPPEIQTKLQDIANWKYLGWKYTRPFINNTLLITN